MKTKYKFIEFEEDDSYDSLTYECRNRKHNDRLGTVSWYQAWHYFVFIPESAFSIFSPDCLADIQHFMGQLKVLKNEGLKHND